MPRVAGWGDTGRLKGRGEKGCRGRLEGGREGGEAAHRPQ